jgi:ADP-heptose:LPS heptosyltransferase
MNGLRLFSLQKEIPERWSSGSVSELNLIDYTGEIEDFSDTAGIIMNLDLVISVDTAVAHLAGALGKPVWTLLPFAPDWRWMLNRDDSPWYPTMRLFRQRSPGDWESVISKVHDELNNVIEDKKYNLYKR